MENDTQEIHSSDTSFFHFLIYFGSSFLMGLILAFPLIFAFVAIDRLHSARFFLIAWALSGLWLLFTTESIRGIFSKGFKTLPYTLVISPFIMIISYMVRTNAVETFGGFSASVTILVVFEIVAVILAIGSYLFGRHLKKGAINVNRGKEDEKEIMTAKEVGEYLGFSKNWVYRQVEKGELPGVRLGGNWRFKKSVIDEWLEEKIKTK